MINSNHTIVRARKRTSPTKYDSLTMVEKGLILKDGKKQLAEIPFSEVSKIYIKVYKLKPIYSSIVVAVSMVLAFLCIESIKLNIEMFMAFLPVIPAYVKTNRFKTYGLVIMLEDGSVFTKKVPLKLKYDTVELINEVKRKCLFCKTEGLASA
ncbi:hypothetical protein [uncultured Flavobacterium sp.]|uniref:hypothetical protein n=1 Tax=uncultured Flavobacterium sp. TaxID=165435 RepID=UPI0030CA5822